MWNQTSTNNFPNQRGQIWCNIIHFSNQVIIQVLPVLRQIHYPLCKLLDIDQINWRQILTWKKSTERRVEYTMKQKLKLQGTFVPQLFLFSIWGIWNREYSFLCCKAIKNHYQVSFLHKEVIFPRLYSFYFVKSEKAAFSQECIT